MVYGSKLTQRGWTHSLALTQETVQFPELGQTNLSNDLTRLLCQHLLNLRPQLWDVLRVSRQVK